MESTEQIPKATILLVDDDPRNLLALQELLASLGQNLLTAKSGEDALRLALKHDLAMILLDVRMPGMDGFETAKMIRARERSRLTPIVFLTAAAEEVESVLRGYEVGAVDYLIKPVIPQVLKSKVSVFVELARKSAVLADSEQKLRALASHLISVREEERTHIAREIHDELGQVLTGMKLEISWLAERLPAQHKALHEKAESIGQLIDATVKTVLKISSGLRPEVLDDMGLVEAIGWQATEFQRRSGIRCGLDLPTTIRSLDHNLSTTMFRVFQEILTNVARHSRATRVDVRLTDGADRLVLEVSDNGVGMPAGERGESKSLGLLGMRERARRVGGDVRIDSQAGKGTRVVVTVPQERVRAPG